MLLATSPKQWFTKYVLISNVRRYMNKFGNSIKKYVATLRVFHEKKIHKYPLHLKKLLMAHFLILES